MPIAPALSQGPPNEDARLPLGGPLLIGVQLGHEELIGVQLGGEELIAVQLGGEEFIGLPG